jgi:hypothetical protein
VHAGTLNKADGAASLDDARRGIVEKERRMNKRWTASALGLALALSVGMARPVAAFRLRSAKSAPGATKTATTEVQSTVTGIIKGAPAGKTYTVVSGRRSVMVDASKAQVRNKGKFASPNDLTPGTFVRALGTLNGTTLSAKTVEIIRPAGGSKKGAGKKGGKKK